MNRIVSKLTTKPVWWWERKRNYPIRSQHAQLPPIPVVQASRRFAVLTTPETFDDALWTAWSWYRFLCDEGYSLHIAVDGIVSDSSRRVASRLFPGIHIDSAQWACDYVRARMPGVQRFFDSHPTGRKLALILALSDREPLIYSDFDVLAFRKPGELLASIGHNIPCYFSEEVDGSRDLQIVKRGQELGLNYIPKFNGGFLYIPKGALPIQLAAQILATWRAPGESWFVEQTVLSFMLRQLHVEPLPPSRYVISIRRQFYWEEDVDYSSIVARHFTTPVRHVMYRYGMPIVLGQSRETLACAPSASCQSA